MDFLGFLLLACLVLGIGSSLLESRRNVLPDSIVWMLDVEWFLYGQILGWSFGLIGLFFLIVAEDLFPALISAVGVTNTEFIVAAAVIALGILAFEFKRRNQMMYGLFEIAFGVASAFAVIAKMKPEVTSVSDWTALAGCVYIVARGISNASDARLTANSRSPSLQGASKPLASR